MSDHESRIHWVSGFPVEEQREQRNQQVVHPSILELVPGIRALRTDLERRGGHLEDEDYNKDPGNSSSGA